MYWKSGGNQYNQPLNLILIRIEFSLRRRELSVLCDSLNSPQVFKDKKRRHHKIVFTRPILKFPTSTLFFGKIVELFKYR